MAVIFVGAAFSLWMGRGLTFFSDEWAFIESRSLGDPGTWMPPHNEHWSTLPVIAYRLLVESVGLSTYVPYLATVVTLHAAVGWMVYRMIRGTGGTAGPALGLVAVVIVAFLGSGFENLLWGFQTGFVGATLAGVGALSVLQGKPTPRGATILVVLLVVGLMTAGIGLVFLAAAGTEMAVRRDWRRWGPLLAIPAGVYAAWFVVWGHFGVGVIRDPFTLDSFVNIPSFVLQGLGQAVGAIVGVGPNLGLAAGVGIALVVIGTSIRGGTIPARTVSVVVAGALLYALIAVSRSGAIAGQIQYTRYTYVAVVLVLVGLAPVVGPAIGNIWRNRPRVRPYLAGAGIMLLTCTLIWNFRLFDGGRQIFLDRAAYTRALITVALRDPLPAEADPTKSLVYVPSPASLARIVAAHGSPLRDVILPGAVESPDAATFARAETQLRDPQVPIVEDPE